MNMKFLPDTEMGNLIRHKNWKDTSLGPIQFWPDNLHNSLSIMMNSRFPMFLFWGKDLISFYNDAYRPSFGNNGMHPAILGKPAEEAWADIWHIVKKFPEQVLTTGVATWEENQLIPIYRNGKTEDVYWTFSHSPVYNTAGIIEGIFVLCMETTQEVIATKKIKESEERFRTMAENSSALIAMGDETSQAVYFNKAWMDLTGRSMEDLIKIGWVDLVHAKDKDRFLSGYLSAFGKRETFTSELRMLNKQGKYSWLLINATPRYYIDGLFAGYISSGADITDQKRLQQKEKKSNKELTNLFAQAPVAMCILRGHDYVVEMANTKNLEIWGRQAEEVMHRPVFEALPEAKGQGFEELLSKVYVNGESVVMQEMAITLLRNGMKKTIYLNFTYEPLLESDGTVSGIISTAIDVTDQVITHKKIEENAQQLKRFEYMAENAQDPFILMREDGTFAYLNTLALERWGYTAEQAKHIRVPDVDPIYNNEVFRAAFAKAQIEKIPSFETLHRRKDGTTYPVEVNMGGLLLDSKPHMFAVARDITERKKSEEKIRESEERYQQLIANAPVAMCLLRGRTFVVELANERMLELWGKKEIEIMNKPLFEGLPEVKGQGFDVMLEGVFTTGIPVIADEQPADLLRNGKIERTYLNFVYEALKHTDGSISGVVAVAVEVTQQVLARKKIEKSQKQFSTLADNISQFTWMANADGYIFWYNKKWYDYTGTNPEQMEGWGWQSVHDPNVLPHVMEEWKKALANGTAFEMTFPLKGADGSFRKFLTRVLPVKNSEGKIEQWFGSNTDISEQLELQALLEYRKALLEAHNEASVDGLLLVDAKGKILTYNKRFVEIWNMPQQIVDAQDDEAALEFAMTQLVHPQQFIEKVKYLYEHPTETSTDLLECKDGKIIERHGYPVVTEAGNYYAWSWTFRDITIQSKADYALKESEQKFRLLADSMPQHIWTADPEGNLNYFNQSVFDYSGLNLEQINERGWLQIVHPDEREENAKQWIHAIQTGETFHFEHRFRRHDGEYKWQLSRAIPQRNAEGKIQMWVGISTEIQQQKEIREQLEESVIERTQELLRANDALGEKNRELEKMNKELESFTYISSHDLQEPLRKIQTFSTRILQKENQNLTETGKDYFQRMQNAAKRMQKLIDDLLAFSRTSTGERKFEHIHLTTIVKEVQNELKELINEKQAVIETTELCELNIIPFQFRQMLHNLISNAIKFTKQDSVPHVMIDSRMIRSANSKENREILPPQMLLSEKEYCHITVKDNGIGFDPQYSERIFEVFQQLHGKNEFAGTGIGLAIVKKIVEIHNGFIVASGEMGKGATFNIYIPVT